MFECALPYIQNSISKGSILNAEIMQKPNCKLGKTKLTQRYFQIRQDVWRLDRARPRATSTCQIDGACIRTNNGPGYKQQWCIFELNQPGYLQANIFNIHTRDSVRIGGRLYSGTKGPDGVQVAAGEKLIWLAKGASTLDGVELCLVENPPP